MSLSETLYLLLVQAQPRKTENCLDITEKLLTGKLLTGM